MGICAAYVSALEHPVAFAVFVDLVPEAQSDKRPTRDILRESN